MRSLKSFVAIGFFAVMLAGCIVPGPGPAVVGPAPTGAATLAVTNQTSGTVCYINVSPCSSGSWGDDILGTEVLGSGATAAVTVQTGCWDLRAQDCDHNILATEMGVTVAGDSEWVLHEGY